MEESIKMTEDRDRWRKYVHGVANSELSESMSHVYSFSHVYVFLLRLQICLFLNCKVMLEVFRQ